MKAVLMASLLIATSVALFKHPRINLSEMAVLHNEFKEESLKHLNLPEGRKLEVRSWKDSTDLRAKGEVRPPIDRYMKPVTPRYLETSDPESFDPEVGKILKIEEINPETGKVERVLRQTDANSSSGSSSTRKLRKVIGFEPKHHVVEVEHQEKQKVNGPPKPIFKRTKIASLYKDRVHNTHKEYLDAHDPVQHTYQFGRSHQTTNHPLKKQRRA